MSVLDVEEVVSEKQRRLDDVDSYIETGTGLLVRIYREQRYMRAGKACFPAAS